MEESHDQKLRLCSGCNLALYCCEDCQESARRSHQRICKITSELPPADADTLFLVCDKDETNDIDAGLRYGTKYMDNLKHLAIHTKNVFPEDSVKLTVKKLSSLLKSKKGTLDSVSWLSFGDVFFSWNYSKWPSMVGTEGPKEASVK